MNEFPILSPTPIPLTDLLIKDHAVMPASEVIPLPPREGD